MESLTQDSHNPWLQEGVYRVYRQQLRDLHTRTTPNKLPFPIDAQRRGDTSKLEWGGQVLGK
eukprot:6711419-Alexandrium_andersonii.AAC.1